MSSRTKIATIPYKKIKPEIGGIEHILHLPGKQRIVTYSTYGTFRVWDLERGAQVGETWEDKGIGVCAVALSPDSKTIASGCRDGAVRLRNIDTGKVIRKWMGHTTDAMSVCWSPDGERVVSGFGDGTFRIWDVESGTTILGPIKTRTNCINAVCYSPDSKMIATGGDSLKVWDASTGKLLTIIEAFIIACLVWTSDGKTLIAGELLSKIRTIDTATWSEIALLELEEPVTVRSILLSPNARILASTSYADKTVRLWNLETNQPIKPSLHDEDPVKCAAFSSDGMFLVTGCSGIHTWDVSAIVEEACLLSDHDDVTQRPAPKIKSARRIPPRFFDDARRADFSSSRIQSQGQHSHNPPPRRFPSFWHRHFNRHGGTDYDTQLWSSRTRNLVYGMLHRRDGLDIELREPPVVEVPCTAGKPRNYHARRKKPSSSSPQPSNTHTTQHHTVTQDTPSSPQQPHPTAIASTLPAVASAAGTTGTISHPHITIRDSGWRARFMVWICCIPIENAD